MYKYLDPKTNKFDVAILKSTFPEGVDPAIKEQYLTPEQFKIAFGMEIEKFNELKKWRQLDLRKEKGFF